MSIDSEYKELDSFESHLEDVCDYLSDITGANVTYHIKEDWKKWSFTVHLNGSDELDIVIIIDSANSTATNYTVRYYINGDYVENKEFHINADDEVEYVSEKAIRYAEDHNFFEDMIDEED